MGAIHRQGRRRQLPAASTPCGRSCRAKPAHPVRVDPHDAQLESSGRRPLRRRLRRTQLRQAALDRVRVCPPTPPFISHFPVASHLIRHLSSPPTTSRYMRSLSASAVNDWTRKRRGCTLPASGAAGTQAGLVAGPYPFATGPLEVFGHELARRTFVGTAAMRQVIY